ncbi:hypothetical protein CCM_06683 [Cordyceps militaris CM01]|uniref:Uncharacterized protein n=1 Tax=Cordyceps militaris (strain CM01) TaxID=983644 RepID=G3JN82_CORMM|nr:uncharacterized protein CCM_06683 [Cordyceps militaris CM01]EGX90264.1 hypothetical protein CCM_06683 [Cordyceps militaris CM01]
MTGLVSKLSKGIDCTSVGHSARGGLWAALERFSRYIVEVQRLAGSFSDFSRYY